MGEKKPSDRNGAAAGDLDALVIGAGLGGLTCAIELARQGLKVCVLEQHKVAGGFAHAFRKKGFHFDVSLHFSGGMDPGKTTHGILKSLGLYDRIRTVRSRNVYRAEYPESDFTWSNDPEEVAARLKEEFPAEAAGIEALMNLLPRIKRDVIGPTLIPDFSRIPAEERLEPKYANLTFAQVLDEHLDDERLKAIFGQLWGYVGLPPARSSATYSACVFSSVCLEGAYQIVGGGASLSRLLVERLRELGGECLVESPVEEIIVSDGAVRGVRIAGGETLNAPVVVSSADPHQTFKKMIDSDELSRVFMYRIDRMETSLSMYSMYLGLDCSPSEIGIPKGNTFVNYGYDIEDSYRRCLDGDLDRTDWGVTSNEGIDDALHPPGCGIVSTTEIAPPGDWFSLGDEEYAARKKAVEERLLAKYEKRFGGLMSHVVVSELGTPRTMARFTRSHEGAVFGLAQTVEQSSSKRLRNRTPIHGLYLTGAWTWAGGGYEGAMMSGIQTAEAVIREEGLDLSAPRPRLHPEEPTSHFAKKDGPAAEVSTIPYSIDQETEDRHYWSRLKVRVYGDDLNSRGHADASSYLRYLDRGRSEAIETICRNLGENSWHDRYQVTIYRVDARCATVVGLADELEVRTGLRQVSTHRACFDQRIVNLANGHLVVDAGVEVLFLDSAANLAPVPDGMPDCNCDLHETLAQRPDPVPFTDEDHFPFRTSFRVYFEDTDLQKITYHVSYVRFCERALFDMIRTVWPDMSTIAWMQKHKSSVARFDVRYMNSSGLGDKLEVLTGVVGLDDYHVIFGQRILLAGTNKVLVDATTAVDFRNEEEQVVPIPKQIVDLGKATLAPGGPLGGNRDR